MPHNSHAEPVPRPFRRSGNAAAGPLVVSSANPRYFTVRSANAADQRAVYLTGSHIWNNLHDGMGPGAGCADRPEPFDFDGYLTFGRFPGASIPGRPVSSTSWGDDVWPSVEA